MTELQETQKQLDEILDLIPSAGSFESARLATQASKLADKIVALRENSEQANQESTFMVSAVSYKKILREKLKDPELAIEYLIACHKENPEIFFIGVRDVAEANGR